MGDWGVKKCGRWEIGGKKMWEVGDWCIKCGRFEDVKCRRLDCGV